MAQAFHYQPRLALSEGVRILNSDGAIWLTAKSWIPPNMYRQPERNRLEWEASHGTPALPAGLSPTGWCLPFPSSTRCDGEGKNAYGLCQLLWPTVRGQQHQDQKSMTYTKYHPGSLRSLKSWKSSQCPGGNMGAAREKGQSWKCLGPSPAGLTIPTAHPPISKEAGNTKSHRVYLPLQRNHTVHSANLPALFHV